MIGEGERDEAPMLYIGERVGAAGNGGAMTVDIAVDPLEGTNLCATGGAGAVTVLAGRHPIRNRRHDHFGKDPADPPHRLPAETIAT